MIWLRGKVSFCFWYVPPPSATIHHHHNWDSIHGIEAGVEIEGKSVISRNGVVRVIKSDQKKNWCTRTNGRTGVQLGSLSEQDFRVLNRIGWQWVPEFWMDRERELQWIDGQLHIDEFTFIIAIRRGWDGYGIIGRASPYSVGSHWLLCTLNYFPYYSHLFAIIHNNPVTPSHSVEIGVLLLITLLKVIVFQEMPFYCRLIDSHDFSSSGTGWLSWVFIFCVLSQLSVESE